MSDESVAHASSQDVSKSVIIELGSTLVWLRLCAKTVGSSLVSSQVPAKMIDLLRDLPVSRVFAGMYKELSISYIRTKHTMFKI